MLGEEMKLQPTQHFTSHRRGEELVERGGDEADTNAVMLRFSARF